MANRALEIIEKKAKLEGQQFNIGERDGIPVEKGVVLLCIHLSMVLTTVNGAVMNTGVRVSF